MKSVYYIHGYQSSPQSTKGTLFKKKLGAKAITYRDGKPEDLVITECVHNIITSIKDDTKVMLIGSSLGGLLSSIAALKSPNVSSLILLNPAIIPPYVKTNHITDMPQRIVQEMKQPRLFTEKITASIVIIRGTEDEVVPDSWVLPFAKAQEATVLFVKDDHRFSHNTEKLPALIQRFSDKKR